MDFLIELIDQHYISPDKEEILSLFNKYGLTELIANNISQLKDNIQKNYSIDNKAPLPVLSSYASNFLVAVNSKISLISDPIEKKKIQQVVAGISVRLFTSIIKLFPKEASEVVNSVKVAIKTTASLWSYNYNEIDHLMNLSEFHEVIRSIDGNKVADEIKKIEAGSIPFLKWTCKRNIGLLTTELKRKQWIASQNEFAKLFNNQDRNLKVRWNENYKYELARLLFVLNEKDFIRPIPSKGYFTIAEHYIVNFSGQPFAKNTLKKLSSKVTQEPDKYKEIIEVIAELIDKLVI